MVQGVGFGGHRLDGDAFACGRGVNLDGVVLPVARVLPDVQAADGAFELHAGTRALAVETETVVDEFVVDRPAAHEARVGMESPLGNVGAVKFCKACLGKRERKTVNLFAQHKVRVPTFGIRHVLCPDVLDGGFDGITFAGKRYLVCSAEREGEAGKCSRPVASELGSTFFAVGLETREFPGLVLQEPVEGVRCPTNVVDKLVILTVPVELRISHAARERGEAATGIRVRSHFEDVIARTVTEQEVDGLGVVRGGNAPGVQARAVAGKNFEFSAVVALEDKTLHCANRPGNNLETAHGKQDRKMGGRFEVRSPGGEGLKCPILAFFVKKRTICVRTLQKKWLLTIIF